MPSPVPADKYPLETVLESLKDKQPRGRWTAAAQAALQSGVRGFFAEFGVWRGYSAMRIAKVIDPEILYGFDSFVGLPTSWELRPGEIRPPGYFSMKGKVPTVPWNVRVVQGWFKDTIKPFLKLETRPAAFIHVDCDIYESALEVLQGLNDRIVPGTVILFDEMYPWTTDYTNWRPHEFRAFEEWLASSGKAVKPLFHDNHEGVAFQVTDRDGKVVEPLPKLIEDLYASKTYHNKGDHWRDAIRRADVGVPGGHLLEFGVWTGCSTNIIAKRIGTRLLHGFDSFEGLPEAWPMSKTIVGQKGAFSTKGKMPKVEKNVRLYKGWFKDTMGPWLAANTGAVAFAHLDCDIYSSAREVLFGLDSRLVPGSVIVFDELYPWGTSIQRSGYEWWAQHEFRALREWLDNGRRAVVPLSRDIDHGAAVLVTK